MSNRLLLAALMLIAAPAIAQVAPTAEPAPAQLVETRDAIAVPINRHCLRHTGSHIRTRATAGRHQCYTTSPGRVFSREDLDSTGHTDIAQALRALDPSIY